MHPHPHTITISTPPQYPVLTLGDGLGSRLVLHEGHSYESGGYVVEECEGGGGDVVRRLVFTSTPHLAQTEVRMVQGGCVCVCVCVCVCAECKITATGQFPTIFLINIGSLGISS